MEPANDPKLSNLLREWKVENAPPSLDERVLPSRRPWWILLLRGSIRVPVPVAFACAVLFVWMTVAVIRPRTTPPASGASEFQPVHEVQVRVIRSADVDR